MASKELEAQMRAELARFHNLHHHNDAEFRLLLHRLQHWQTERLKRTHADLLEQPEFHDATAFFISDMYGGVDLTAMADEVERILNKAIAVLPQKVMETSLIALQANSLTLELDEELAHLLAGPLADDALTEEQWIKAYRAQNRYEERVLQMDLLKALSEGLDKYVRSKVIYAAFKMAKKPAYHYRLNTLYDFMGRGFACMKPMGSAADFADRIVGKEKQIIENLRQNLPDPFRL